MISRRKKRRGIASLAIGLLVATSWPAAFADTGLEPNDFSSALAVAEEMPRLRSLLVSHAGELVVEEYFNGARPNQTTNVKSVSKTIMSALVGLAIEKGHIERRLPTVMPALRGSSSSAMSSP